MNDPRELVEACKALEGPETLDLLAFHLRNLTDSAIMDQIDADRISRAADAVELLPAMRDALRAAVVPRVKPLLWEPAQDPLCHDHWSAPALGGAYHMAPDGDRPGVWLLQWTLEADDFCMSYGGPLTSHGDPEAAKAAAQADYEARILSALDTAPAKPWKPINTAPRDGTRILAWWPSYDPDNDNSGWCTTWWGRANNGVDEGWESAWEWEWPEIRYSPTHWMPHPQKPEVQP